MPLWFKIFLFLLLSTSCQQARYVNDQTRGGEFLKARLLDETQVVTLQSEWWYVDQQWVGPQDYQELRTKGYLTDRLSWIKRPEGPFGKGSFGLFLGRLPKGSFAFYVPPIGSAYAAYVLRESDGEVVKLLEVGQLSTGSQDFAPAIRPTALRFDADGRERYLVLFHIQNEAIKHGGFWRAPLFGSEAAIDLHARREAAYYFIQMIASLIFGLFSLSLFLRRRRDRPSLWLALTCLHLSFVLFVAYVYEWVEPSATILKIWMGIRYSNLTLTPLFSYLFINRSVPHFAAVRWERPFMVANVLITLLLFLIDPRILSSFLPVLMLNALILMLVQLTSIIRATRAGNRAARISGYGYLALFVTAIFDIITINLDWDVPRTFAWGILVYLYFQNQVTASLFAAAYRRAEHLSQRLQMEVERQTRDIKLILQNIQQGIFTIDGQSKRIQAPYSLFLEELLNTRDIKDKTLQELLFDRSDLSEDHKSQVNAAVEACLGDDTLAFELNEANFAKELRLREGSHGSGKLLEIDWAMMLSKEGIIEKILVCMRDVTEIRQLETMAAAKDLDFAMLLELLNSPESRFQRFYESTQQFMREMEEIVRHKPRQQEHAVKRLFIHMHTIKGNARSCGFKSLSDQCHVAEQQLARLMNGGLWDESALLLELEGVRRILASYERLASEKLNWQTQVRDVRIQRAVLEGAIRQLDIAALRPDEAGSEAIRQVRAVLIEQSHTRISMIIEELKPSLGSLARDLGKHIPTLRVEEGGLWLHDNAAAFLHSTLVHLFRNAMDHGLETEDERLRVGKKSQGTITVAAKREGRSLSIAFSDDGRGLDLVKIRALGLQRGLITDADDAPERIASLIFHAGLSTKDEVSDISGRGVGMEAVRAHVEAQGGSLSIELQSLADWNHVPFRLIMTLSDNDCLEI